MTETTWGVWLPVFCRENVVLDIFNVPTSLEGICPGGLIKRGKNLLKRFDSLYKLGH